MLPNDTRGDFHAQVEHAASIVQANTIHLHGGPRTSRPIDWIEQLQRALHLLNRTEQVQMLGPLLRSPLRRRRKLIGVVQGVAEDIPRAFVQRITDVDLPRIGDPCANLDLIQWPRAHLDELFEELNGRLVTALDANGSTGQKRRPRAAFEHSVRALRHSVVFSHVLDGRRACRDGGKILTEWLRYFAEDCPAPSGGHAFMAFLCIEYRRERSEDCARLAEWIEVAAKQHQNNLLVLPPLMPVYRLDIQEWAAEVRRRRALGEWAALLEELHMHVFPDETMEKHFFEACQIIKMVFSRFYSPSANGNTMVFSHAE